MDLEWDEAKDAENQRKHGLSLADAARLDWARGLPRRDTRYNYGEVRYILIAPLGGRLHVCVYVLRPKARRIISLRKANLRERRSYAEAFPSPVD